MEILKARRIQRMLEKKYFVPYASVKLTREEDLYGKKQDWIIKEKNAKS
jgi:hypothetical protein